MSTCNVYIWIPADASKWGFYNLHIEGTVNLGGYAVNNPIFSYGTDSKLRIYPLSQILNQYPATAWASYQVYKYSFTADNDEIKDFADDLKSKMGTYSANCTYVSPSNCYLECTFKDSCEYVEYSAQYHNSLCVVGKWANILGKNTLRALFNDRCNSTYIEYLPKAMSKSSLMNNFSKTTYDGSHL